jgi:hypothetical protein
VAEIPGFRQPRDLPLHRRRQLIVAGAAAVAAEQIAGIRYPVPAYVTAGAAAGLLLIAGMVIGWRRNRKAPAVLIVDEQNRSFRTPTHAAGVLMALSCLHIAGLFLAVTRESVLVGLGGAALFLAVIAGTWSAYWNGTWIAFHPDRLVAAKGTGILTVPWDALTPDQPGAGDEWHQVKLAYAHRDRATTTGLRVNRDEVSFEATNADLVVKAVATYAAHPDRRAAIGTPAELDRLREGLPTPLRGIFEAPEPAPRATTIRRLVVGAALFAAAVFIADLDHWVHYASTLFGFAAAEQLLSAYRGWRAARRARATA